VSILSEQLLGRVWVSFSLMYNPKHTTSSSSHAPSFPTLTASFCVYLVKVKAPDLGVRHVALHSGAGLVTAISRNCQGYRAFLPYSTVVRTWRRQCLTGRSRAIPPNS
jgi:hypothetical protein